MSKILLEDGTPTTATDENRLLWYSPCGYWTDDWNKLPKTPIPICPYCGAPGFQVTYKRWFEEAKRYQDEGNPEYVEFLAEQKETCYRSSSFLGAYKQWRDKNA